jgi:hypothetical protein
MSFWNFTENEQHLLVITIYIITNKYLTDRIHQKITINVKLQFVEFLFSLFKRILKHVYGLAVFTK